MCTRTFGTHHTTLRTHHTLQAHTSPHKHLSTHHSSQAPQHTPHLTNTNYGHNTNSHTTPHKHNYRTQAHSGDAVGTEPVPCRYCVQLWLAAVGVSASIATITQEEVGLVVCLVTAGAELEKRVCERICKCVWWWAGV